ncbi:MAG TPA: coproporphyrinogen dehydrogenase HemZ [Candidatus Blautia gallistercoris]|uniref:Coproporphyrinogen dehydrogenase HemZ n=1 Tax=Candidatus Blautia gallistercoris TaxID=2838490 RepID=A0A9D1WGB4_9FIRM|nr:coproporphyrinogen dehydrogenase HemZ [Candidatus Blautia gallistercoris]
MKRGIIPLCKIVIEYQDREFENDIYALVKAFYPGAGIFAGLEKPEDWDLRLQVREDGSFLLQYKNKDGRGTACVETVQSEPKDMVALLSCKEGDPHALRRARKNCIKRNLYWLLARHTGRQLPWGDLTGIRPVKLAMGMLEEGMKNTEIAARLRDDYFVSPQKTALAVTIANREREILKDLDYEKGYSLYVGIPFCPSICLYCSFSSSPLKVWKNRVEDYLCALHKEIQAVSEMMRGRTLNTIYIGGGTPTTLEPDQLERLLTWLGESFSYENLLEFTVEAGRPDSITMEKLQALRKFPVTRISVNPQTMHQSTLDLIGRKHTVEDTRKAFALAREAGFDNINMDLIVGLPGEDQAMVSQTLEEVRKMGPDSLTIHSLAVKRAARLNIFKDQYKEMTSQNSEEIMDRAMRCAYEMEMGPYYLYRQKNMTGNFENVGYAKVDKAGIYNILIMEEKQPIIALGAGGASKLVCDRGARIERVENVKDVKSYIERIDEMIERKRKGIETYL